MFENNPVTYRCLDGIDYISFPLLESTGIVRHLFSTRRGGVSNGIFSSMNLSYSRGDDKSAVDENFSRIARVLGCKTNDFVLSSQTHTTNILRVYSRHKGMGIKFPRDFDDIDGLITDESNIVLCTFFADCVPIYFVDTVSHVIGLAHSGWRGTVGGIGRAMIGRMSDEFGSKPENIRAVIGPSICADCYEVGSDTAKEFTDTFPEDILSQGILQKRHNEEKYSLNLWKANEYILLTAGILPQNLAVSGICTCCNHELLFSHRATHGKRGNLGAFLGLM